MRPDASLSDPEKEQQKRAAAQRQRGWGAPGALQPTDLLGQNDAGTRARGSHVDHAADREAGINRGAAPMPSDAHAPNATTATPDRRPERAREQANNNNNDKAKDKAVARDQQLDLGL